MIAQEVSIHEAKTHLSRLLQAVERGERVFILNRGRRVAVLQTPTDEDDEALDRVFEEIKALRDRTGGYFTTEDIKRMIEDGRT